MRADRVAALALAAALLTACGSSTDAGRPEPSVTDTRSSVTVPSVAPPATAPGETTPSPTPATIDARAALLGALDRLGATYHFVTTAGVDGAVVATVEGDRVGDGARLSIRQGTTALDYVVLPDSSWVRPDGGDWDQVGAAAAGADPIAALRAPTAVVLEGTPDDGAFVVTVPSTAIGVPGDGAVEVRVTVLGGAVTSLDYRTTVDGRPAEVRVMIGPVVDGTPVVAPA